VTTVAPVDLDSLRRAARAAEPVIVVVDTCYLFDEAIARLRDTGSGLPLGVGGLGLLPWYAPEIVANELARTYESVARRARVDPDALLRVLTDVYLPAIRFVALDDTDQREDRRVAAVAHMDADDVDQARLALLLAPAQLYSADKHLRLPGLAPADRKALDLVVAAEATVREGDAIVMAAVTFTGASGAGAMHGARQLAVRLEVPVWIVALAGLGGAALAVRWIARSPERRARAAAISRELGTAFAECLADTHDARHYLHATSIQPSEQPSHVARVARALIISRTPLLAADLHQRLAAREDDPPTIIELRALLRDHPAFVRVERSRWQLGQTLTIH
jgi:predicted nucleic acid-binding protein